MLTLGRIVAAVLSGLLLAQSYGLTPFWAFAWIAPVPLLIAVMGATRVGALVYGALAGALSMAFFFPYLMELSGPAVPALITLIKAIIWGGMCLAVRAGARRLPAGAAVFVFPLLVAGVETLVAAASPHGSAGSLAYSQMNFLPAIQVAALGGAPSVTFVLSLFASLSAHLFARRVAAAAAPLLIVAVALGWGWLRQQPFAHTRPDPSGAISVALLAADSLDFEAADWRPAWERYAHAVAEAAGELDRTAGARIIVLPEKIVVIPEGEADEALAPLEAIAREHDAIIVVGATAEAGGRRFNRAYLITPEGVRAYDKQHMIPGLEAHLTPGEAILIADVGAQRLGVLICKDMDFPTLARRYGEQGLAVMLVPAWDFGADAWLHSRMAVLRGVEGGYAIVRSAREGVMTVSNPLGEVLIEATSGGDTPTLARGRFWPNPRPTLYALIGDAFGWLCAALSILLIGWIFLARRRAGQGS